MNLAGGGHETPLPPIEASWRGHLRRPVLDCTHSRVTQAMAGMFHHPDSARFSVGSDRQSCVVGASSDSGATSHTRTTCVSTGCRAGHRVGVVLGRFLSRRSNLARPQHVVSVPGPNHRRHICVTTRRIAGRSRPFKLKQAQTRNHRAHVRSLITTPLLRLRPDANAREEEGGCFGRCWARAALAGSTAVQLDPYPSCCVLSRGCRRASKGGDSTPAPTQGIRSFRHSKQQGGQHGGATPGRACCGRDAMGP